MTNNVWPRVSVGHADEDGRADEDGHADDDDRILRNWTLCDVQREFGQARTLGFGIYYRHLGIADGMSIARVWACRDSK